MQLGTATTTFHILLVAVKPPFAPFSIRIHPIVNVSRIHRYREQVKGQKVMLPLPVKIQGEMEYKVEKILNKRKRYRKVEYLVQ